MKGGKKVDMSEILEKLKAKAEQVGEYISITEIPSEVTAMLESLEFKIDKRGNECLFVRLKTKDNKIIVQKYTPTTYESLYERINDVGWDRIAAGEYVLWRKERRGRAINDRLYPYPIKKKQ
jgi:hypothetical protein